jgi:molecular chaperone Hsp31 and glyoxalase 3
VNAEGSYDPSSFTIKMATQAKSDYKAQEWSEKYTGDKPILVVATDEGQLTMKNGKVFNTGNHPIEMLVPMLHFRDAGFSFDFATARGEPVVLEMWAFPNKDENVKRMQEEVSAMMKAPKKLESIESLDGYAAIFVPGGHGCMINLPSSAALGRLLNEAHDKELPTVTICHGPAAYLSTSLEAAGRTECAYKGYKTMCFTTRRTRSPRRWAICRAPCRGRSRLASRLRACRSSTRPRRGMCWWTASSSRATAPRRRTSSASWRPR